MLALKNHNTTHPSFNIDDRVFLKSNPKVLMTVSWVAGKHECNTRLARFSEWYLRKFGYGDGDVLCTWYKGLTSKIEQFSSAMVEKKD